MTRTPELRRGGLADSVCCTFTKQHGAATSLVIEGLYLYRANYFVFFYPEQVFVYSSFQNIDSLLMTSSHVTRVCQLPARKMKVFHGGGIDFLGARESLVTQI